MGDSVQVLYKYAKLINEQGKLLTQHIINEHSTLQLMYMCRLHTTQSKSTSVHV